MERIKQKIYFYYDSTMNFLGNSLSDIGTKEGFKKYLKNTGWLFIGRMSGMVASFFVGAYVARYLGPEQYGLLSYAVSFTGLFSIFSSIGIDGILSRELISHPEKREELLGSGFFIKILGSIIAIILIIITLLFLKADLLTNILILISAATFIFNAFGVIDTYFQSQVLSKKTVKIQIISLISVTILKLIFILFGFGLICFAMTYLIDAIIIASGLIIQYKRNKFYIKNWEINKNTVLMILKNSWPLILSVAAVSIYMKVDQVMITRMIGSEANGLYSVAARISEIWYFIPGLICASLFPAIVNAKKTDNISYEKRLKNLYSLMFYLSLSIAILISIFSDTIILKLFGDNYSGAINVLQIHIWAGIGIFIWYAIGQYLVIENYTKILFGATLISLTINVILNIILIPRFGIIGAAIATLISYVIQGFSIIFFKETRGQFKLLLKAIFLIKK